MAIIWTFEDRLDLLHPLHRVNGEVCNSLYNRALLVEEIGIETGNPLDLRQQLDTILDCNSGDEVIDLVNHQYANYGFAYNVWHLRSDFVWIGKGRLSSASMKVR